jgi:hypothetical protein
MFMDACLSPGLTAERSASQQPSDPLRENTSTQLLTTVRPRVSRDRGIPGSYAALESPRSWKLPRRRSRTRRAARATVRHDLGCRRAGEHLGLDELGGSIGDLFRRVLEAAFPDAWLPDDVRELLTDLTQGGYVDADVTMLASQLLAKYSQQADHG